MTIEKVPGEEHLGPSLLTGTLPSEEAPIGTQTVGGLADLRPTRTFRQDAWRRFKKNKLAVFGLFLIAFLVLVGVFGPTFVQDPYVQERDIYRSAPDATHWFGTDQVGRDELARVVHGIRLSLIIGLTVSFLATLIGVTIGSIAGYLGRWVDATFMRIIDILLGIPYIILAFALIAVVGRGVGAVIITLAISSWLVTARVIRAAFLQAKEYEYVEAARAVGVPGRRIVWRHILPNVIQPVIVLVAVAVGTAVLAEAALSFLGVGVQEPTPSLGLMISRSRSFFSTAPWLLIFPGMAIMLTVLGFLLVGDGLRDALDVKES